MKNNLNLFMEYFYILITSFENKKINIEKKLFSLSYIIIMKDIYKNLKNQLSFFINNLK